MRSFAVGLLGSLLMLAAGVATAELLAPTGLPYLAVFAAAAGVVVAMSLLVIPRLRARLGVGERDATSS
ncbi:MAG TPA: hypothetical protein VII98_01870 [Solirubrobacteraceae bacterium]